MTRRMAMDDVPWSAFQHHCVGRECNTLLRPTHRHNSFLHDGACRCAAVPVVVVVAALPVSHTTACVAMLLQSTKKQSTASRKTARPGACWRAVFDSGVSLLSRVRGWCPTGGASLQVLRRRRHRLCCFVLLRVASCCGQTTAQVRVTVEAAEAAAARLPPVLAARSAPEVQVAA